MVRGVEGKGARGGGEVSAWKNGEIVKKRRRKGGMLWQTNKHRTTFDLLVLLVTAGVEMLAVDPHACPVDCKSAAASS